MQEQLYRVGDVSHFNMMLLQFAAQNRGKKKGRTLSNYIQKQPLLAELF